MKAKTYADHIFIQIKTNHYLNHDGRGSVSSTSHQMTGYSVQRTMPYYSAPISADGNKGHSAVTLLRLILVR